MTNPASPSCRWGSAIRAGWPPAETVRRGRNARRSGTTGSCGYAQRRYLGPGGMTERVRNFAAHPQFFAMPHPSWRTLGWERRNPWFAADVVPALHNVIRKLL